MNIKDLQILKENCETLEIKTLGDLQLFQKVEGNRLESLLTTLQWYNIKLQLEELKEMIVYPTHYAVGEKI